MPSARQDSLLDPIYRELVRLRRLHRCERVLRARGYRRIAGVDEAGRGCFAGPVVAAAVVLEPDAPVFEVDDSKALDAEQRRRVLDRVRAFAVGIGVGVVTAEEIDERNILVASRRAMVLALERLPDPPDCVVSDAVDLPEIPAPVLPLVKGDSRVACIAAASIVAKTFRDAMMDEYDRTWPWYGFSSNRGYGTDDHRAALLRHGPSPIHRLTFRGVVPSREECA